MTDAEHARAIAAHHVALMRAVFDAWEAGLTVEPDLTLMNFGPWSLRLTVRRTVLVAEGDSVWRDKVTWLFPGETAQAAQGATP
jgi:hypothetical protein